MTTYTYQTIDPPGSTHAIADSINDKGQIVGVYEDSNHVGDGFLDTNGIYTTIDPSGSVFTGLSGINSDGQIVGRLAVHIKAKNSYCGICTTIFSGEVVEVSLV
jgi:hypothetical protein